MYIAQIYPTQLYLGIFQCINIQVLYTQLFAHSAFDPKKLGDFGGAEVGGRIGVTSSSSPRGVARSMGEMKALDQGDELQVIRGLYMAYTWSIHALYMVYTMF